MTSAVAKTLTTQTPGPANKPSFQVVLGIYRYFASGLAFLCSVSLASACGIDWRVPINHFDGVNQTGQLSYWRGIGILDCGNGLKIPLILGFSPGRAYPSIFGRGWIFPLLESNVVQLDERQFLLTQPDGITRKFWRNKASETVLRGQGEWMGEINGNTINLWASCGWKLGFNKGKITSIKTPENRVLNVIYSDGKVSQLLEGSRVLLGLGRDSNSELVIRVNFGESHIGVAIGERPVVEALSGANVIGGVQPSLTRVSFPDLTQAIYSFGVDDQRQPTLEISGDQSRFFTWNPQTGQMVMDGGWVYEIKPDGDRWGRAAISRRNSLNQTEFWHDDRSHGQEIIQRADGVRKVISHFITGPLEGNIRKIEETVNGRTSTIMSASYGENGRLLRKVLSEGQIENYSWRKDGSLCAVTREKDGKIVGQEEHDSQGRLIRKTENGRESEKIYFPGSMGWSDPAKSALQIASKFLDPKTVARIQAAPAISGSSWQHTFYDHSGNPVGSLGPEGNFRQHQFGPGYHRVLENGLLRQSIELLPDGRPKEIRLFAKDGITLEEIQRSEYPSARERITKYLNPDGTIRNSVSIRTDELNRIVECITPTGGQKYTYDQLGHRLQANVSK